MSENRAAKEPTSFFEIDAKTRARLLECFPVVESALPQILSDFYEHLSKRPEVASRFGATQQEQQAGMAQAAAAQTKHWKALFSGKFDENYVMSVRRIGRVHYTKNIDVRWYIGGYAFVLNRIVPVLLRDYANPDAPSRDPQKISDTICAINQAVMLDMALAISVYSDEGKSAYVQKIEELSKDV